MCFFTENYNKVGVSFIISCVTATSLRKKNWGEAAMTQANFIRSSYDYHDWYHVLLCVL